MRAGARLVVALAVTLAPLGIFVPGSATAAPGTAVPGTAVPASRPIRLPAQSAPAKVVVNRLVPPRPTTTSHPRLFPGQSDCQFSAFCWTPGEPVIAVGPTQVLQTANSAAAVYDKATGNLLASVDFSTFWSGAPNPDQCGDPRALYLSSVNRFAFSCADQNGGSGPQPMRFAISQTGDASAGKWYQFAAPNTAFLDQEKINATSDKFIISGNDATEEFYVYNLTDVVAGTTSATPVHLTSGQGIYQAAAQQTLTSQAYYVTDSACTSTCGQEFLATITGTPTAGNVALSETNFGVLSAPGVQPPSVPGGLIGVFGDGSSAIDSRIYDAVYEVETSDHKPVIQYSTSVRCGTPSRACMLTGRIDLSGSSPVRVYEQLLGEPGWDYTYGAAGLDAAGDVFLPYSRSNASNMPGVGVLGPGFDVQLQAPASGTTACSTGQNPPCFDRWGDYLGTAIDPSSPGVVWVSGLYEATSGTFGWGSIIAKASMTQFALPTATTGAASSVTQTSATVAATVNPNGLPTTAHIDYGTTTAYDASTTEQSVGNGTTPVGLSVPLSGLTPGTLYHYRVYATAGQVAAVGADHTFFTPGPPAATTNPATNITVSAATLNGTANPDGADTTVSFQWGTTKSYGNTTSSQDIGPGISAVAVSASIPISVNKTYHYRLVATSALGTTFGNDRAFPALKTPKVTTKPATKISHSAVTMNGVIVPSGLDTTWFFQYGPTTSYGNQVPVPPADAGSSGTVTVSVTLSGLPPGKYHFRLVGTSAAGTVRGKDLTFTIP